MTNQVSVGDELRAVMGSRPGGAWMPTWCWRKLKHWQGLARKYHGDGLTRQEVQDFWQEINDDKTRVELVLGVTARDQDWERTSREVKTFIDELTFEVQSKGERCRKLLESQQFSRQKVNEDEENVDEQEEEELTELNKYFLNLLVERYGWGKREKRTQALAAVLTKAAQTRLEIAAAEDLADENFDEPEDLLEFLLDYVEALEADEAEDEPQRAWSWGFWGRH